MDAYVNTETTQVARTLRKRYLTSAPALPAARTHTSGKQ